MPQTERQRGWKETMGEAQEPAKRMDRLKAQSNQKDQLTLRTLLRILETLAPNVQSPSVFFESRWLLLLPSLKVGWRQICPSLPSLTALTITYRALVHAEWNQWRVRLGPPLFPSLKRLEISGIGDQYYTPFHCYLCLLRRAPSLTHLCIPEGIVDVVNPALAVIRPDFGVDLRGVLPSHLERVFILLAWPPRFVCCGGAERCADECARCHWLSSKDERFAVPEVHSDGAKSESPAIRKCQKFHSYLIYIEGIIAGSLGLDLQLGLLTSHKPALPT